MLKGTELRISPITSSGRKGRCVDMAMQQIEMNCKAKKNNKKIKIKMQFVPVNETKFNV
jgi:hypothetical protein